MLMPAIFALLPKQFHHPLLSACQTLVHLQDTNQERCGKLYQSCCVSREWRSFQLQSQVLQQKYTLNTNGIYLTINDVCLSGFSMPMHIITSLLKWAANNARKLQIRFPQRSLMTRHTVSWPKQHSQVLRWLGNFQKDSYCEKPEHPSLC